MNGFTDNAFLLDECTGQLYKNRRKCWTLVLISYSFVVPVDTSNMKDMLEIRDVRLSAHKGAHLSDSDGYTDIGLSSEEEAQELDPAPQFRRKFDRPNPPQPDPAPPIPPQPQQSQPSTSADQATVTVPKEALQQVHALLGQILQGQVPTGLGGTGGKAGEGSFQMPPGSNPFNVRRAKEGEKVCQVCQRKFWNTDTLRRHQKTHTGAQRYTCTNPTVEGN